MSGNDKPTRSVMADGITDEQIGKAAELLRAYPGLQLPLSSSAEDVVRLVVAAALAGQTVTPHVCSRCGEHVGYMLCDPCQEAVDRTAGRTVVNLPEPEQWTVFDLQPDDVLLIGNVHGAEHDMDEVTRRLRDLYPERRFVFFGDGIDVKLLRDVEAADAPDKVWTLDELSGVVCGKTGEYTPDVCDGTCDACTKYDTAEAGGVL